MNEHTHQNSCQYADELVSYLYEEIGAAEKSRFENHLANCSSCADELDSFSLVRSSIIEWRAVEFQPLANPAIRLPVQKVNFINETSDSRSLLAQIRALFSLSPAWMGGAAAAALVICIGLLLIAVNFQRAPETARVEKEAELEALSSPTLEEIAKSQTAISDNDTETVTEKSSEPPIIAAQAERPKNENVQAKVSRQVAFKNRKTSSEKSVKPVKSVLKKPNQSPPPTLLADEDDFEDNSLRLADIFKGVGGR